MRDSFPIESIEVDGAAAGDEEDVTYTPFGEPFDNVVRKLQERPPA